MKCTTITGTIAAAAVFIAIAALAQQFDTSGLELVSRDQVPDFATVWVLRADGSAVPLPCLPLDLPDAPVYAMPNGSFLIDATAIPSSPTRASRTGMAFQSEEEEGGGDDLLTPPPDIRNYQKFIRQAFSVVDTNNAAVNDTNLYNTCISFPYDASTGPTLQIARYGTNAAILKANHFDYSAETRDFALLVCDKVQTPTWKSIDLSSSSNSLDGWLIQGLIPNWQVTDPMFMMVSNINIAYNEFFRAIPYSGPQFTLTGAQPYATVSNTVTLTAAIADLSGTTNQQYAVTVNGLPTRYSINSSNTISIDTPYAPNGIEEVELSVGNQCALVSDPGNPTPDTKTAYSTTATLPLDFENDTYLVWASDLCSPDVGINYILFAVSKAQQIAATIKDPASGETLASYGGYVPWPAIVEIPWSFTKADGVTPYTNDTYSVTFVAYDPTTLIITNRIARGGVRAAGRCIVTYEEEDPSLIGGSYLNSQASTWIGSLASGYATLYASDWGSFTEYSTSDIGANRDNSPSDGFPWILTGSYELPWGQHVYAALTNTAFSDFGFYMGHGNGTEIGGHPPGSTFVNTYLPSTNIQECVWYRSHSPNWMMRKVALWACYTDAATPPADFWGNPIDTTGGGTYPSWQKAFGIRDTRRQNSSWVPKNVGLFFGGGLPEGGYSGTLGGTCPEVAAALDDLWISGPYPFPGACDPTYAFSWAVAQIEGMSPEIMKAMPAWIGFGYLPYTGIYDGKLLTNDVSNIKR
jgi:hypothetical protein